MITKIIHCPYCQMSLHRRSNQEDLSKIFLVCPNCGHVWSVPLSLKPGDDIKQFEVTHEQTVQRALDGVRL